MDKIKDTRSFDNSNFWESNPGFLIISPFSELYESEYTKEESSKIAWCISLFCETSDKSIFAHFPEKERKEELNHFFPIPWEDELIQKCLKKYPFIAMTAAARSLKEEEDILMSRTEFLRQQYDIAIKEKDISSVEKLERMLKNNSALYDNLEKAQEKFSVELAKAELRGGREESFGEQGLI